MGGVGKKLERPCAVAVNSVELLCTQVYVIKKQKQNKQEESKCKIGAAHLLRGWSVVIQISGISYKKKTDGDKQKSSNATSKLANSWNQCISIPLVLWCQIIQGK